MQVNTITNTSYVSTVDRTTQTQESKKASEAKFDMTQPFDIDSFTFEDYKAINYDELEEWIKNSNLPNEKEVLAKTNMLAGTTVMTNDDTFNRVLFDKTNESYDKTGESLLSSFFLPLAEPLVVKKNDSTITESMKNDPSKWSTNLTGGRRTEDYFFNIDYILNKMQNFPEYYNSLKSEEYIFVEDISKTLEDFDEILTEYTKRKDEQNATLDAYIRNTKQNPVLP